jgi:hypothetical protein
VFRLFIVFVAFAMVISLVWSAVQSSPMNYSVALFGSEGSIAGRYLYPVLMAWFVAGAILPLRIVPDPPANAASNGFKRERKSVAG